MATPLDAERARLRALGLTDEEISRILVEQTMRSSSPQAGAPAPGQMPMSGVLGNASAAVSYGRAAIFGIRGDIRNLFDRTAPTLERAMSGGILAFKLVVVAVVCFAIYQEWQRHVIYDIEIAKEQAAAARATSCKARWEAGAVIGRVATDKDDECSYYADNPLPNDVKTAKGTTSDDFSQCYEKLKKLEFPTDKDGRWQIITQCMGRRKPELTTPATLAELSVCFNDIRPRAEYADFSNGEVRDSCLIARFNRSSCFKHLPEPTEGDQKAAEACSDLKGIVAVAANWKP